MNQLQVHPAEGVVVPDAQHQHHDTDAVHKTAVDQYVTSENELHSGAPTNEVLERDAQTKGRWFQYVKTKQFWITLLLGQGMY